VAGPAGLKTFTLGIRPEDVGQAEGTGWDLVGKVCLVERLGPVCLVTFRADRWTVTARLPPAVGGSLAEGATAALTFAWQRAHRFDGATGKKF
jgi:hypothetical protein